LKPLAEKPPGLGRPTISHLWLAIREDAEFACRSLARAPTYTTTLVLTLALAIGGITAVFSVLYAVVLRPLPFPDAHELVALHGHYDRDGLLRVASSPGELLDIQQQNQSFSKVAAWRAASVNLTGRGEAVHVAGARVSADFFRLFGLAPAVGRDFAPGEDNPGAAAVVMLSSSFHRRAFDGAREAIGQSLDIDGKSHTIIGVLHPAYDYPRFGYVSRGGEAPDVWIPLPFDERELHPSARKNGTIKLFARLRPDVTLEAASADIDRIVESFYRQFPENYKRESGYSMFLEPLQSYGAGKMGRVLWLLLGAVTLVLLAACANAASLTLARLASRRREIGVRAALGATEGRIALQFLVESVIVAVTAGVLGIVIGRAGMDGLLAMSSASLSNVEVAFQLPVLAFALGVSVVTGVIAGAAPAWHAARLSPTSGLREGGRSTNAGAIRLRSALVVAQVTVALVLLVCTAMLLRNIVQLTTASPGFEPKDVYVGQAQLAPARYKDDADRRRFADGILERLRATAGIESVGLINTLPFAGGSSYRLQIEGDPVAADVNQVQLRMVGGDYLETLGFELVAGRFLGPGDTRDAPKVAVISDLTVRKYFNGRNPLGMRILDPRRLLPATYRDASWVPAPFTIVGIVADTREMGIDEPVQPFLFVPFDQWPQSSVGIAIRAPKLGPSALAALAAAVAMVDPTQPLHGAKALETLVDASLGSRRFTLLLLSVFAALGLSLAVLGIYGITSYSVAQRTQELAVRMAMGADDIAIVRLVLAQVVTLLGIGALLGAVVSALVGPYLASQIYGLSAWDPAALGIIVALLVSVAVVAGWIPARRAAALPLASALRTE
jgi:putative ABC transport system permease protein